MEWGVSPKKPDWPAVRAGSFSILRGCHVWLAVQYVHSKYNILYTTAAGVFILVFGSCRHLHHHHIIIIIIGGRTLQLGSTRRGRD